MDYSATRNGETIIDWRTGKVKSFGGSIIQFHDASFADDSWRYGIPFTVNHTKDGFHIWNRGNGCGKSRPKCLTNANIKNKLTRFNKFAPMKLGQWNDFVMHIKWSPNSDGFIKLWINGKQELNHNGSNYYNEHTEFPYFKMGLYQYPYMATAAENVVFKAPERTLYFDEFRIGNGNSNYKEIAPKGSVTPTEDTQAPSIPQNLNASDITQTSVKLNWNASTDNVGVKEYEVNYNDKTKIVAGTSTTLSGLTPNVNYSIKVLAKDAAGNKSTFSNPETAVTNAKITTPVLIANAGKDKIFRCTNIYRTVGDPNENPATSDNANYQWTTADGHIRAGANAKVAEVDKAGTYTLTVSKKGSTTVTDSVIITHETGCTTTPDPVPNYTVNYIANTGGKLTGTATQTVKKGQSASSVSAVANNGYTFIGWSDGKTSASRTDANITSNLTFRATFSKNADEPDDTSDVVDEPVQDKVEEDSAGGTFPIGLLMLGLLAFFRRK